MEKKKSLSWDERHPNGDLSYHTFLDSFEDVSFLHEEGTKVALRTLKYHLEEEIGYELSDEAFLAIFFRVINLRPAHPLGGWSFQYGFVVPMQKTLQAHNLHCGAKEIIDFFNVRNYDNRRYHNLLLHVPHSSTSFPVESKVCFNDLDDEERLLIDYYTDDLFIPEQTVEKIDAVVFPYCRLFCDVERLVNDPLEKDGLGISYLRWVDEDRYSKTLRSFSSMSSAFKLYSDFHTETSLKLIEARGNTLLIDCHSFSSVPNLLNSNPPDIDICIGYNDDETRPNKVVIGNIVQYFKSLGYKVGINTPFSNSKTFSVPSKYHSVMIEINKKLYMDELTREKSGGYNKLKQDVQSLYWKLLKTE